jgi:hypothetical protein
VKAVPIVAKVVKRSFCNAQWMHIFSWLCTRANQMFAAVSFVSEVASCRNDSSESSSESATAW